MDLNTPISQLNRVGKTTAKKLGHLGVHNVQDLLYYFPFRYDDYRKILSIAQLRAEQLVTVLARVELIANKRSWRSRKIITEALVSDQSGSLRIVWFNQPFLLKNIHSGDMVYFSGKVKADMLGAQLISPSYEKFSPRGEKSTAHTARLVPIYPLTAGVTQKQIRFLMSEAISLAPAVTEWLPAEILEEADLAPLASALRDIHFPADENNLKASVDRLKFDELFVVQLRAELARQKRNAIAAPAIRFQEEAIKKFVAGLPFVLTKSQKIAAWEILQDIAKSVPMNRLLSGDVGSGKTVVAAMAIYNNFLNGYQAALMAPTEILAQQHFQSLTKLFSGLNLNIALLTGSQAQNGPEKISKAEFFGKVKRGAINVLVGTHALLGDKVKYKNLSLVVVDEQHRFGVEQRKAIKDKGKGTHFLSMTATPIPRSVALLIYGDLDLSMINELPPGRKKIITKLVGPDKRKKAYDFIRAQVKAGRQIFVICPRIHAEEGEGLEVLNYAVGAAEEKKSVLKEYARLAQEVFPDLRVGYLHGRLKAEEKETTMSKFTNGQYDLLVSTSVIEVGIDIPNASVMMIEGAENFGLAQLHQFRGRVGRAAHQSYCLLFANAVSEKTRERLEFFEKNNDGFKLAEKDLVMRGPGEVYGTEQSGEIGLRLAKLTDREIIKKTRQAARNIAVHLPSYPAVLARIKNWQETHWE